MKEGYGSNMIISGNARLMLITHRNDRYTEAEEAKMFCEGGGTWLQLRMKDLLNIETAENISGLCKTYPECLFFVNDKLEIALQAGASGVHLGKKDMPLHEAWEIIRAHRRSTPFFVGATANTFEDIRHAVSAGASYIGLGPYRYTDTKKNLSPVLGLEGYKEIMDKCREAGYTLPVMAIGGIRLEDVGALMGTGITGIAVSGSIVNAADPTEETRKFLKEIHASCPDGTSLQSRQ